MFCDIEATDPNQSSHITPTHAFPRLASAQSLKLIVVKLKSVGYTSHWKRQRRDGCILVLSRTDPALAGIKRVDCEYDSNLQ